MTIKRTLILTFSCLCSVVSSSLVGSLVDVDIEIALPKLSYADLLVKDKSVALEAANALISLGALQIVDVPNFSEAKAKALDSLASCMDEDEAIPVDRLMDGSFRKTIDAISTRGKAAPMSHKCGESAAGLRDLIDAATYELFSSLDSLNDNSPSKIMEPYTNFVDLTSHGDHLEHLHSFYGSGSNVHRDFLPSMELHTDSGLFIAMTTGSWNNVPSTASVVGGVYIQTIAGNLARMKAQDDAMIFMVGEGGANWLSTVFDRPFRAVPHLLVADVESQAEIGEPSRRRTRSWYGKMFLPPSDAIVGSSGLNYATFKRSQVQEAKKGRLSLPLGCGENPSSTAIAPSIDRKPLDSQLALKSSNCGANELQCWTVCYNVYSLNLTCGMNAICVDTVTMTPIAGSEHCPEGPGACVLMCGLYPPVNDTGFCTGGGQSMDMVGFVSTAGQSDTPCFNLLFPEWTLSTGTKFGAACFGVFLLGIAIQLLTQYRAVVAKKKIGGAYFKLWTIVLYGIQVTLSYFIMLVAMTYSAELFAMVIVGLTVGYGLVNLDATPLFVKPKTKSSADDDEDFGNCCHEVESSSVTEKLVHGDAKSQSNERSLNY